MDTILTLERLTYALDQTYNSMIDMSDTQGHNIEERRTEFLSRSLSAFCVNAITGADPARIAFGITDGYKDQGIDCIFFDEADRCLYLVQGKWRQTANKTVELGDCTKFISGVTALIRGDFSNFNEKVRGRESELRPILLRSDVRITLVIAYSSPGELADPIRREIESFLAEQNNVGDAEVFTAETFNLSKIYASLSTLSSGRQIAMSIALTQWGTIDSPFRAYYGQVKASEVVDWRQHGKALLDSNLRFYRGATDVNEAMESTLVHFPDRFWYFNNGITVLCSSVTKTVLNGDGKDFGIFDCRGVRVVNGAQTVGVIWELARKDVSFIAASAKIHVRIISLEHCPQGFDVEVTRAANLQNRIQHRDFAALDREQQRLAHEMALDGKIYSFKSGESDPKEESGCNIEEATVALACMNDVSLAVQAKREIGGLWRDIKAAPYTTLFNEKLSARNMWRAVRVSRAVAAELAIIDVDSQPRGALVAVHGNRYILYRVFHDPLMHGFLDRKKSDDDVDASARKTTKKVFVEVAQAAQAVHPSAYLATLFKNAQKCKDLMTNSLNQQLPPMQDLFAGLPS